MTFEEQDLYRLVADVVAGDSDRIATWLEDHIHTRRDAHALMEFVCQVIFKVFPMGLTKDAKIGRDDFWALDVGPTATSASTQAARMVAASLNADLDTLTALIVATLIGPEEEHSKVIVELLIALRSGLVALPDKVIVELLSALSDKVTEDATCPERITVENWAGLPLDCILRPGHEGPHRDGATGARWVP